MKAIINGRLFDSEKDFIIIAWDTDDERKLTGKQIKGMPKKEGPRLYMLFPDNMDPAIVQQRIDKALDLMDPKPKCPECGADLILKWSGVKCSKCEYWYCS